MYLLNNILFDKKFKDIKLVLRVYMPYYDRQLLLLSLGVIKQIQSRRNKKFINYLVKNEYLKLLKLFSCQYFEEYGNNTMSIAGHTGNLQILEFLKAEGLPIAHEILSAAINKNNIFTLQWFTQNCPQISFHKTTNDMYYVQAIARGSFESFVFMAENRYNISNRYYLFRMACMHKRRNIAEYIMSKVEIEKSYAAVYTMITQFDAGRFSMYSKEEKIEGVKIYLEIQQQLPPDEFILNWMENNEI